MTEKLVWIDVGTHRAQEYRSIFSGDLRIAARLWRFNRRAKRNGETPFSLAALKSFWATRRTLTARRKDVFAVFVEANTRLVTRAVYAEADAVFFAALGARNDPDYQMSKLFLVHGDDQGQGSSIYESKSNIGTESFVPCVVLNPASFARDLKAILNDYGWDYKIMLRINCEGAEDEVIYAMHECFGDKLAHIFGSLKDVRDVKGDEAYDALMTYMDEKSLPFRYFSSEVHNWPESHKAIETLLKA